MTLKEEARQEVLKELSDRLSCAVENLVHLEAYDGIISEMTFDKEVDLMIVDIMAEYKKETSYGTITPETHAIIGGLTELVHMLYEKRVNPKG